MFSPQRFSEKLPAGVATETSISPMGKTHQRHFWGSLSKLSHGMTPCSGASPGTPSTAPPGWWPGRRTLPLQAEYTTTLTHLPRVHSG